MGPNVASVTGDRKPHWVKLNHQNRIPKRWIAFDTESNKETRENLEIQTWRIGCAIRWRTDLKTGDHAEYSSFDTARDFWEWVSDYCKSGTRTICVAHNLGHDARISDMFQILPSLGFTLEWCNLDSNVSSMTWRSDHGSLVFSDLWTWLPMKLANISTQHDQPKLNTPADNAPREKWERYCMRDAEIVYWAVSELIDYIRSEDLGNWQPTGAGMAYAVWRHKFMTHKVLVHDDAEILALERQAMYTGRAEAWKHGTFLSDQWTEIDMRNAYVTIASEVDLPTKLKFRTGRISNADYRSLTSVYRCLVLAKLSIDVPAVPCFYDGRILWPTGQFTGTWWDPEIDIALDSGAKVEIIDCICYTKRPILKEWAQWILSLLDKDNDAVSPVVRTWAKHCGRALIGRISLRTPSWQAYASNPLKDTGITWETNGDTGETYRLMSVGDTVFRETDRVEYKDSLPQVTGYIMSECRARLWYGMAVAGFENIAHVDTDSVLVNGKGLSRLKNWDYHWLLTKWQLKASYNRLTIYGPRNYRPGNLRKTAGIPRNATEVEPNVFMGESWHGVATDLEAGRPDSVTVEFRPFRLNTKDPRRSESTGADGDTVAYQVYQD